MMHDLVEKMFCELLRAEGFSAWYETESRWDAWADYMVKAGLDPEVVGDFFSEMTWDL
jgi:hypothetical protein